MNMDFKPIVYLTSNVFLEIASNEKISVAIREEIKALWNRLDSIAILKYHGGRFPTEEELKKELNNVKPNILGCHLSHQVKSYMLDDSDIFSIATSTAGYNHIERTLSDNILITHTPGVLHETVADYTIALIMANLRNLIGLNEHVWTGKWTPEDKWDLDQSLSSVIDNKTLGIVGLGEIGTELVKRLYPWGLKILYYDIRKRNDIEKDYPEIEFVDNLEDIFRKADIVSIHVPLNKHTEKLINKDLLKLMTKNALLVNTARGPILDMDALLELLEKKEVEIDLALDVFPMEPIDSSTLQRLKKIKESQPERRMILIPHNASADADTRGKMVVIFLENIIRIIESSNIDDLKDVRIIPEHRAQLSEKEWKIQNYWKNK